MKILHYTLGFEPARSGGLINYATDLMQEQHHSGHQVFALYPGKKLLTSQKIKFSFLQKEGITRIALRNSLPLALFGGIKSPTDFMTPVEVVNYLALLKKIQPDVVHLHTLMGLHLEFLEACRQLNIPTIFTSHDYFGLAPEPNFFDGKTSYHQDNTALNWQKASEDAWSTGKLRLFQSRFYPLIRTMGRRLPQSKLIQQDPFFAKKTEYQALKSYYLKMFRLITKFHFNSQVAESVYRKNLPFRINGQVSSITTNSIYPRMMAQKELAEKINVAYIGPAKKFKGFADFLQLAKVLPTEKYRFHTFGYAVKKSYFNIHQHGRFEKADLAAVYHQIDLLIVPSQWQETFGLIVLEALSFQIPVLVSEKVGAKDILPKHWQYKNLSDLIEKVKKFDFTFSPVHLKDISQHSEEILTLYRR
ncbi:MULTISPECIES: glycosyltransferase [Enterococcus]|uniref:glycosyltransferase n=1 Tax=Enterococcus sp. AZ103 TaxID=2774628 RepID=UPI003F23309C